MTRRLAAVFIYYKRVRYLIQTFLNAVVLKPLGITPWTRSAFASPRPVPCPQTSSGDTFTHVPAESRRFTRHLLGLHISLEFNYISQKQTAACVRVLTDSLDPERHIRLPLSTTKRASGLAHLRECNTKHLIRHTPQDLLPSHARPTVTSAFLFRDSSPPAR